MKQANRMVGTSVIGAAMLIGLCTPSAQAAFVMDLTQEGSNVVGTGRGSIDLTDLTLIASGGAGNLAIIGPLFGAIQFTAAEASIDFFAGFSGPTSFGTGDLTPASSGSGVFVGIIGNQPAELILPHGYVSGNTLSDGATWESASLSSLGATPGTYEWTWGTGAHADSFTLQIGPAAVPEPSTWAMMLLGFAGLGLAGWRHRRTACKV
jgi:hypothetical protein